MTNKTHLIASHGGYRNLKSFQMAEIIFDFTYEFVKRYIPAVSRTRDQMEQAARSGKQNISEGSQTSGVVPKSELMLVNVARASLEELKNDFEDVLRLHRLPQWDKNNERAGAIRKLAYKSDKSYSTYKTYMSDLEAAANCALCLINQANYLLDEQMRSLALKIKESGVSLETREQKLTRILQEEREREAKLDALAQRALNKKRDGC